MPQIEEKYEDIPRFDDNVKVGDKLVIIGTESKKTEKNGYDGVVLSLQGGDKLFTTNRGVLYQLSQVKGTISPKDPLKVVVADYTNDYGTHLTIKNQK